MSKTGTSRKKQSATDTETPTLLDFAALQRSEVVANARMNRERNLSGPNSYETDLGLDPMNFLMKALQRRQHASWLDLCCGTGRALLQAAEALQKARLTPRIKLIGVDLVPMFDPIPPVLSCIRLVSTPVESWETDERFDLITSVHGLHYLGDKLGVLQRASRWLKEDGLLMMHLDYRNVRIVGRGLSGAQIGRGLHRAGFRYVPGRHLVVRSGNILQGSVPYRYLGADDKAGPNYTGQEAVDSYYERIRS